MRDTRQVFWAIVTALVSIALLFGVFSLSLVEGNMRLATPTLPPTITLTLQPSPSKVGTATPLPPTRTPLLLQIWTPTLAPSPTNCPPPPGWLPYIVQSGDSLEGLAQRYKMTGAEINQANCLGSAGLLPGLMVYLPPVPTKSPVPCGAPGTWVIYVVQQGDTLYHLGQVYGIPFTDIQRANCLSSTNIHIGQRLYVPPWAPLIPSPTLILPSDTPSATWNGTPTDTDFPTATVESYTPTDTATDTPTPTPTASEVTP